MTDNLIAPHGGTLVNLLVPEDRAADLKKQSADWPSWDLTPRQLCDLELLTSGGFSPLRGFLGRTDYESVRDSMRLADGTLWPIPVTLDVSEEFAEGLAPGTTVALRDAEGVMLAALHVSDVWRPDVEAEAAAGSTTSATSRGRSTSAARSRRCRRRCTTTTTTSDTRRPSCGRSSPATAGGPWSRSRPATRCTGRTRS